MHADYVPRPAETGEAVAGHQCRACRRQRGLATDRWRSVTRGPGSRRR